MFSLGMVIHFMAFMGKLPYAATGETAESLDELRREVQGFAGFPSYETKSNDRYVRDERRHGLPEELHELLRLLLSRQPEQRPSCQEVLDSMNNPHRKISQSRNVFICHLKSNVGY